MAFRRYIKNNSRKLVELAFDTVNHIRNSKLPEGPVPIEDIPISSEELDIIAEREIGGLVPDFGSLEEAGHFNERLLDDVSRKTLDVKLIEAGADRDYGHEAKTYEGQSDVDYCLECSEKHSQTVSMLMTEALQRAEAGGPGLEGVKEKVKGAIRELTGMEDDTETVDNPSVMELNTMARALRKHIYQTGAAIGRGSIEEIRDIKSLSDQLVEATYDVREAEDGDCPSCREAVGIGMGLNVARSLEMPDFDEIQLAVKEEKISANKAMDRIIGHAKKVGDEDAQDYLEGVKKMMNTPL